MGPTIYIFPRRVTLTLALFTVGLVAADVGAKLLGDQHLIRLFDLDAEQNVPTWFASSLLLAASALLAMVTVVMRAANERYVRHWGVLSLIFLCLSCDETAVIHEKFNAVRQFLPDLTLLHFPWVLAAAIGLIVMATAYFRFVVDLPSRTRMLVVVAGCFYVGGAAGIEVVTGYYIELSQRTDLVESILNLLEEGFETFGIVIFIQALMTYLEPHMKNVQWRFDRA